jgi:hypothetical protein
MTMTDLTLQTNDDVRRLVDQLARDLAAAQRTGGSRDLGPDVAGPTGVTPVPTATAPTDQDAQRLFGGILGGIVSHVIPMVAPHILSFLRQRRRELGLPEERDDAAVERDFQSILSALLPKLIDAVPSILSAISGQAPPRDTTEEGERFLPFLAALIPAVVSAVPSIISMFNRQRGVDDTPPPITDPDVAQRFLGPLFASLVPQLLQAAPAILGSIFGPRRDVATTTW